VTSVPFSVAVPICVAPEYSFTMSPLTGAAAPDPPRVTRNVGLVALVLSSTLLVPLSLAGSRSTVGAEGAVVSGLLLVTACPTSDTAALPAMSWVGLVPGV
jgi:hypothetical protein